MKWAFLLCALLVQLPLAHAGERIDVCAEYVNSGKSYHVHAISTNGNELNRATRTFDYNGFSKYVVIFWAENQATVIEMGCCFFGTPSAFGTDGRDQEDREWRISSYSAIRCGY
jgi:hypothetical protein